MPDASLPCGTSPPSEPTPVSGVRSGGPAVTHTTVRRMAWQRWELGGPGVCSESTRAPSGGRALGPGVQIRGRRSVSQRT